MRPDFAAGDASVAGIQEPEMTNPIKNTIIEMEVKDFKQALNWQCIDEITKVPRPSCHEQQIRA